MEYFQSVFKHRRMVLAGAILAFVLGLGCSTHKAENMTDSAAGQEQVQASDTVATDNKGPVIETVTARSDAETVTVEIQGSGPMAYTSIKQAFPFGIAVYLPNTALGGGVPPVTVQDSDVSGVKVGYADEDKTTAKVEILLVKDLLYTVKEGEATLSVVIQKSGADEPVAFQELSESAPAPDTFLQPEVEPSVGPATLTNIEFDTAPSGRSDIRVATSHPIKYEARQAGPDRIELVLFDTRIPDVHTRPLLTKYFNSAVQEVQPKSSPGKSKDGFIEIRIREQVPYQLRQTQNGIHMAFEPSSVSPPTFSKAKQIVESGQRTEMSGVPADDLSPPRSAVSTMQSTASAGQEGEMMVEDIDSLTGSEKRQYTGEKIKLDFFDTDIKNVFRILKSVSGLNFAIDGDVTGKVTLSLEEPVPWDQVLDLVLKMNQLGKKREGNVVRIASLTTIKKEEEQLQDAIKARKESLEQARTLEPMITEYISISYANAGAIMQQVIPFMSKALDDRGTSVSVEGSQVSGALRGAITVDERTNMIIMTDTQEKIDQAYKIINELDKVTPQIMIEARVVEVTKEFSRSLGMSWNMTNASSTISGFADDYGVAVNQSAAAGIAGEFSFFRLFGSSVTALNAQLEAAEETGDSKIVSSPRILTLDNKKAKIKQGYEYAYLERDDSGGSSVSFKEINLLLEVTPHVTPDKRISMNVSLTKNDVYSITNDVPNLATNEAETELLVNDNETVVIGGVVKTTKKDSEGGIPFLSGIPVLGKLFGITSESDERKELLIFLTPSIVQLEQKQRFRRNDTMGMN